jgi:integrase/recombinase XerD
MKPVFALSAMLNRGCAMRNRAMFGPWIRRFLLEHLVRDRNLTSNTQASYRDTLLLLVPFVSQARKIPIDRLMIDDLSPALLRSFLEHLQEERGCSGATRNLRLAAIHSLAKFIGMRNPEHLAWSTEIRAVPFKKTQKSTLTYLNKPEIDALLNAPNLKTSQGRRDYALLLFLYNTGARAEEAAHLTVSDITWGSSAVVRLVGKGNKTRFCPIWRRTAEVLKSLVAEHTAQEFVFLNRLDEPLTRFGIYSLVRRAVGQASRTLPTLATKRISPHCLRHSCAVHLLRSGVDINTIRAWLGHVSLDTTHIYAEVDLEMKEKALALCDLPNEVAARPWRSDPGLIEFLRAL